MVFIALIKGWSEIIVSILLVVTLSIILIFMLVHLFPLTTKKSKYRRNTSLYHWMDDLSDYDEGLMYSLKRYSVKYGTIDNLKNLKNMLIKLTNNDKLTLKMYRAFYSHKSKESGEELYLRTILVSLIPLFVLVFKDKMPIIEERQVLFYYWIIFSVFIILAFISMKLSINKKRNSIIIEMIGLCIEDIEDEENQIKEKKACNEERRRRTRKVHRIVR